MSAKLLAFAALVLCTAQLVSAQQHYNPDVEGRWVDELCIPVPNTPYFRKRTMLFGAFDDASQTGTWQESESYWRSDNQCTDGLASWIVFTSGEYFMSQTRATVERFWHIDYAIQRRRMDVFNQDQATYLDNLQQCNWPSRWIPNVEQDITRVRCPDLNLIPATTCPTYFDIIRRTSFDVIFVGQEFPGFPPTFQQNCFRQYRPTEYDPYGLALFKPQPVVPVQPPTPRVPITSVANSPQVVGSPGTTIPAAESFDVDSFLGNKRRDVIMTDETDLESTLTIMSDSASTLSVSLLAVFAGLLAFFL